MTLGRLPQLKLISQLPGKLSSGPAVLFVSMTVVNGGNYLFNLLLGRWLGPALFADLSLIITLMLMVTFLTLTLQMTAAKFAAMGQMSPEKLQNWLFRMSWRWGIALLVVLAAGAPLWQRLFKMASPWPFVLLGVGLPFYLAQGVGRGLLQGEVRFMRLALSYQAEMWVRLLLGLLLVALGGAIEGAVGAVTLSFVAAWLLVRRPVAAHGPVLDRPAQREIVRYAGPVLLIHLGQILINNSDILLVKRLFTAEEAGLYAAVALIGRIIFFATMSIVTVIFPLAAQKQARGEPHRHLLWIGLGIVAAVSGAITAATFIFPEGIITILFGEAYLAGASLVGLYALATALYALANVFVTYHLALNNRLGTLLTFAVGFLQIGSILALHASLAQVILVQICLMGGFTLLLLVWDNRLARHEGAITSLTGQPKPASAPQTG